MSGSFLADWGESVFDGSIGRAYPLLLAMSQDESVVARGTYLWTVIC